jgi:hypothetical protein
LVIQNIFFPFWYVVPKKSGNHGASTTEQMPSLVQIITSSLPDVMIFKIFSPKNSAKKLSFLTQNKAKVCKILIITLVFEKNGNFLPKIGENRRKL